MKRYRSHKVVEAAPILRASPSDNTVTIKDDASNDHTIIMPIGFFARGEPQPGDYLVRYQPEGYLSWSPKGEFEAGYSLDGSADGLGAYVDGVYRSNAEIEAARE